MKLKYKISFSFSAVTLALLIPIMVFYTFKNIDSSKTEVMLESNSFNQKSALMISRYFQSNLEKARVVSSLFNQINGYSLKLHNEIISNLSLKILKSNSEAAAFWYNRQLKLVDSTWVKDNGRYEMKYYRTGNNFVFKDEITDKIIEDKDYKRVRLTNSEAIYPPYIGSYTGKKEDEKMYITVAAPLQINNKFVGLAGMDFDLDRIAAYLDNIKPFDDGFSILLHSNGKFIYHPEDKYRTKNYKEFFNKGEIFESFENDFNAGSECKGFYVDSSNVKYYCSFIPIHPAESEDFLYFGSFVPNKIIVADSRSFLVKTILLGLLGIVFMTLIIYKVGEKIVGPIVRITNLLKNLSLGKIDKQMKEVMNSGDELAEMTNSANTLIDSLEKTAAFAKEIGKGHLDSQFESVSDDDVLGQSLIEMRNSLAKAKKEENTRKKEDEKQKWSTMGLAKINEILRQHDSGIEKLSINFLKFLVDYTGAIQGGLFVSNKSDENNIDYSYELTGAIAYNRQKLLDSSFKVGEGLIGRCAFEKLTIYLEDVPDNYVNITSGLGEANPRSILIVPAVLNSQVYAIIELVSFEKFLPHQIEFVEKIGESIAATISNIKTSDKTNALLIQSKHQAEALAAQEEEMRQNLEELQATQEEVSRMRKVDQIKNQQLTEDFSNYKAVYQKIIDHIPAKILLKDIDGNIVIANNKAAQAYNISHSEIIGKNDFNLQKNELKAQKVREADAEIIKSGIEQKDIVVHSKKTPVIAFDTRKHPFIIDFQKTDGILDIQLDISSYIDL